MIALLVTGCLTAPPDPVAGDPDGDGDGDDGHTQPDGGPAAPDGPGGCVAGTELDLVWVDEVAFDHAAQDQVTLRGLMILVNAGPDPIALGSLTVVPPDGAGAVQAEFTLTGSDFVLGPGEAMGALNTAAGAALYEFDEEWTDLHLPELDAVFGFDGSGEETEVPLVLEIGGYSFDLSITVRHDPLSTSFDWVRGAERTTAFCDESEPFVLHP